MKNQIILLILALSLVACGRKLDENGLSDQQWNLKSVHCSNGKDMTGNVFGGPTGMKARTLQFKGGQFFDRYHMGDGKCIVEISGRYTKGGSQMRVSYNKVDGKEKAEKDCGIHSDIKMGAQRTYNIKRDGKHLELSEKVLQSPASASCPAGNSVVEVFEQ